MSIEYGYVDSGDDFDDFDATQPIGILINF